MHVEIPFCSSFCLMTLKLCDNIIDLCVILLFLCLLDEFVMATFFLHAQPFVSFKDG